MDARSGEPRRERIPRSSSGVAQVQKQHGVKRPCQATGSPGSIRSLPLPATSI